MTDREPHAMLHMMSTKLIAKRRLTGLKPNPSAFGTLA